jgi:ABC-type molybdate transport system ATPase subunit
MHLDDSADQVIAQIAVGGVRLLAEVTRDAVSQLGIVIGMPLHVLIKSVSIEVRAAAPSDTQVSA